MASYLTSTTLIDAVKRKGAIPESQVTFEDTDFLAFANEEMQVGIVPSILQFHEEYLVYEQEVALVDGQLQYEIPDRAIGQRLRNLFYEDTSGNRFPLSRIDPTNVPLIEHSSEVFRAYFVQGSFVVLIQDTGSMPAGNLVMQYFMKPNQLVPEDEVGVITAINTLTGVVTISDTPTAFTTGNLYDFVQAKRGHRALGIDLAISAINTGSNLMTFTASDLPDNLAVGDHVALRTESFIPMIPDDLHPVLAQRVVARCMEALGDQNGLNAANTKMQELEQRMGNLIDNRVEGSPQKINNLNGLLRNASRRRGPFAR